MNDDEKKIDWRHLAFPEQFPELATSINVGSDYCLDDKLVAEAVKFNAGTVPAFQDEIDTHRKGIRSTLPRPVEKIGPSGMSPIVYEDDVQPELQEMMRDRILNEPLDGLDVEPGEIHPRLLSVALLGKDVVKDDEDAIEKIKEELTWLNVEHDINKSVKRKVFSDVQKDIEIGKKIAKSLITQGTNLAHYAAEDRKRMEQITLRDMDQRIMFVPVDSEDPRAGAKRALLNQSINPDCEIEPVFLKDAFDDVAPLKENFICELHAFMTLTKPTNNLPDQVRISVPNKEIPFGLIEGAAVETPDVEYDTHRYVHLDPMPKALKSVIMAYLGLIRCDIPCKTNQLKHFKNAIRDLNNEVQIKLGTDEDLEKTG